MKEKETTKKAPIAKTTVNVTELLPIPKTSSKIFIHSLPRKSVLGLNLWTNDTSGKRMEKTKIGNRANDKIPAFYSKKVGGLQNGLSYHYWLENGLQVVNDAGKHLTLQDKMEIKWGLPEGYLHNRPYMKGNSLSDADLSYYQKTSWVVRDGSTVLDTGNMEHDLGYRMFLDSKFVANSLEDRRSWPKATHYITHEGESDQFKYKKSAKKAKAFSTFYNLSLPYKRKFTHILEIASSKVSLTEEQITNLLFDYIDKSTFKAGSNLDKFMQLAVLLDTADGKEMIEAKYLLKKAIDNRVVYEKQGAYNWNKHDGLIILGDTLAETLAFLLNPKKQVLIEDLEKEIKAKTAY